MLKLRLQGYTLAIQFGERAQLIGTTTEKNFMFLGNSIPNKIKRVTHQSLYTEILDNNTIHPLHSPCKSAMYFQRHHS